MNFKWLSKSLATNTCPSVLWLVKPNWQDEDFQKLCKLFSAPQEYQYHILPSGVGLHTLQSLRDSEALQGLSWRAFIHLGLPPSTYRKCVVWHQPEGLTEVVANQILKDLENLPPSTFVLFAATTSLCSFPTLQSRSVMVNLLQNPGEQESLDLTTTNSLEQLKREWILAPTHPHPAQAAVSRARLA